MSLSKLSTVWLAAVLAMACGNEETTRADASVVARDAGLTQRDAALAPDGSSPLDASAPVGDASVDAASPTADAGTARLIFVGDFEAEGNFEYGGVYSQFSSNVDTCEHDETCETDSMEIVTSPVRGGDRALRITLRDGDLQDTGGTRAEIQTGSHYDHALEEDFWYGWSIFVPSTWVSGTEQKVVHQWHTGGGNPGGNPIIGLRIRAGTWQITREFTEGDNISLWRSEDVARGEWTDWVMRIRWSPTSTGHFTAWRNGEIVYSEDGPNMHPETSSAGHYQKLGMYGGFSDESITERVLYYDEIRVAVGANGYEVVAPR